MRSASEAFVYRLYEHFMKRDWQAFERMLAPDLRYICDGATELSKEQLMRILRADMWEGTACEIDSMQVLDSRDASLSCISYHVVLNGTKNLSELRVEAFECMVLSTSEQSILLRTWTVSNK